MVRPYTAVEVDNRAAFVVQLNALLGSLKAVMTSNALSGATKSKLEVVLTAVEEWQAAIGPIEVSKPYALPANAGVAPPVATVAGFSPSPTPNPAASGTEETPDADADADAAPSEEPQSDARPPSSTAAGSSSPSPATTVATEEEAAAIGVKTVVDLVGFIGLLYTSGLPESPKLRAMARGVAKLLMVRCTTIVYAALQHVVRLTYHSNKSPEATLEVLVLLSRDMRRATSAMVRCLEVVCSFAEFSDVSSVRFTQQICMDALRNVRRAMLQFKARVDREEALVLAAELGVSATASPRAASAVGSAADLTDEAATTAAHEDGARTPPVTPPVLEPERLREHCAQRAAWLRTVWGPSLTRSIVQVGHVMAPAVRFLVSVAGVKEVSGPPGIASLKQNAQDDLFALGGPTVGASPKDTALVEQQSSSTTPNPSSKAELDDAQPRSPEMNKSFGSQPNVREAAAASTAAAAVGDTSADHQSAAVNVTVAAAAALVLPLVGFNLEAECLAVMAECSGDESDGKLVATRIVTDTLRVLGETQPQLLHTIVQGRAWKQRLFTGILNSLVSMHPAVLEAGLQDLHLIVTCCPGAIGAEVGYLYNNCLLKLLESENSPIYTKKEIIIHIVMTLLAGRPTAAPASGPATTATTAEDVPLLLQLYRLYDLNEGAHQLNVIQQFVAALSRVVRSAALTEFSPIGGGTTSGEDGDGDQSATTGGSGEGRRRSSSATLELQAARHASLPSLALRGLVLLVEVLSTQTPPEDDACTVEGSTQLPAMKCRERKLEGQRRIDIFVASPKKGIQKVFNVTAEEFSPPGHEDFAAEWDHSKCPAPATDAIRAKIVAVTDFLINVTSTCPDEVAEFLTTPAVFSLQVCVEYMSRLPLAGCGLVDAIQVLLAHVELPKEGQRIERLLEYFGSAYYTANNVPGVDRTVFPFIADDSCFVVIVATVMLNTDLHNPRSTSRMNQTNFRAQLKGCDKVITDAYADDIFLSISRHPLNSAKSLSAASAAAQAAGNAGSGQAAGAATQDSYYRFDALFISVDERRKLAFGMEQQRLVSETMASWQCAIPSLGQAPTDVRWWCGVARDLFTCTWPSVCAVFGPAMYQQNAAAVVPDALLLECIRGLKSVMCVAAAFALPTECEVTLLALLGLCDHASVRPVCRVAVLQVAATGYAVHLTARCWTLVFQLLATMRAELQPAAMPPQVEAVLSLIERVTSTSCTEQHTTTSGSTAVATAAKATAKPVVTATVADTPTATSVEPPATVKREEQQDEGDAQDPAVPESIPTAAVHRVLDGVLDVLKTCKKGDARTLAAGLYFLRRVLQYARITHTSRSSEVVTFVNVRDFSQRVLPRLVALVTRQSSSEEALQSTFSTIVDLLAIMWQAHAVQHSSSSSESQVIAGETVECYNVLRACYTKHVKSTLIKAQVLQSIQELMGRTLRTLPGGSTTAAAATPPLMELMLEVWRRVLSPVSEAVSARDAGHAQTASLAVLVLRKIVVWTCGTQRTSQIPAPCQTVALVLLTDVAFVGALCGDAETSQACLAQLTTLCGGCLSRDSVSTLTPAASSPALSPPRSPLTHRTGAGAGSGVPAQDAVPQLMAMLLDDDEDSTGPDGHSVTTAATATSINARLASYGMERLCLLTRTTAEQTRNEAITNLRTLCLQLKPAHVRPLTVRLCHLVVEGLGVVSAAACGSRSASAPSSVLSPSAALSFDTLFTDVPQGLRPVPRETLNATLPALLHLLTQDLLGMAEATQLGDLAQMAMTSCLTPLCAAPRGTIASPTRAAAIKALMQCATLCVSRYQASTAAVPTAAPATATGHSASHDVTLYFPVQTFLDAMALTLLRLRIPVERVVPTDAAVPAEAHWGPVMERLADAVVAFQEAVAAATVEAVPAQKSQPIGVNGRTSTDVARDATADLEAFSHSGQNAADEPIADDALVESCALTAQLLSGLPHVIGVMLPLAPGPWHTVGATAPHATAPAPPHASPEVLLALLLDAAQALFAMQWRTCHVAEMDALYSRLVHKGSEAQAVVHSSALLPHTAVRGVLNSYLELALLTPSQTSDDLLEVLLGILEGLGAAQQIAANAGSVSQHRLNAQEQQHTRTCSAGMYQELSIVLASWIKTLTTPTASSGVPAERLKVFETAALDPRLFLALASLLTPTAGPLIVTVRDFFAWYISKNGLHPPAPSNPDTALSKAAPADAAVPASASNGRVTSARASFVLDHDDEL